MITRNLTEMARRDVDRFASVATDNVEWRKIEIARLSQPSGSVEIARVWSPPRPSRGSAILAGWIGRWSFRLAICVVDYVGVPTVVVAVVALAV